MLRFLFACLIIILTSLPIFTAEGLIHIKSSYNVTQTADQLETILSEKGMTVFNRIKHSESAQAVGVELKDTELIIFGNPKVGSPLMLCQQTVAIELPQKALIWEDASGTVRITYNDPGYLQKRHDIQGCDALLAKISKVLSVITQTAASPK